ncbi:MAG: hypothetical protein ICV81_04825 [Flavisolibacter sp.]|nr:hypothetical protein [Flavisolibacter sp.]
MKETLLLYFLTACFITKGISQDLTSKEKAESLAQNEFSKSKYKKVEKYGVVKEMNKVITSTPVVQNDLHFYNGNYWYQDLQYKMEIRTDAQDKLMATLSMPNKPEVQLKNVSVNDAYFTGVVQYQDGSEEKWEGVFIDKNDNGNREFGLGIKLSKPIQLTEGLQLTRLFFKKVSPQQIAH